MEFNEAVDTYVEEVIALEKKDFKEGLEPFSVYAEKIRKNISQSMYFFQKAYARGYQLLVNDDETPHIENEVLQNPELFITFLLQGGNVYELLGFSPDVVNNFLDKSVEILKQKRYEDAKEAFYFLVVIAPNVVAHWLGLALAYVECGEIDLGCQTCEHAIDLDQQNSDSYLTLVRIYTQMKQPEEAQKVCDRGIAYALEHRGEEWAEELGSILEYTKNSIKVRN